MKFRCFSNLMRLGNEEFDDLNTFALSANSWTYTAVYFVERVNELMIGEFFFLDVFLVILDCWNLINDFKFQK